jgi:uncharacterized Zn finger protein
MSYWGGWRPYVPVWKRRQKAAKAVDKLRRKGVNIQPVALDGRKIAETFWGKAWCEHLEKFSDYENRLPRGRTYVRNGSVCHLDIQKGKIEAKVSGSSLYNVKIGVKTLAPAKWKSLKQRCAGQVGSMLELLQGRLSNQVMSIVTDKTNGLFPLPKEIDLDCSCPDWAEMCKHVAAVLYGVGARLDRKPELIFLLRGVDHGELVSEDAARAVVARAPAAKGRLLDEKALSEVFGIEVDTAASRPATTGHRRGLVRPPSKSSPRRTLETELASTGRKPGQEGPVLDFRRRPREGRRHRESAGGPTAFPSCLGGGSKALERTIAQFERALRQGVQGRRVGKGPARQYAKALRRFAQFVKAERQRTASVEMSDLKNQYLQALGTGRVQAPASELIFARAALNRFARFLDEKRVN